MKVGYFFEADGSLISQHPSNHAEKLGVSWNSFKELKAERQEAGSFFQTTLVALLSDEQAESLEGKENIWVVELDDAINSVQMRKKESVDVDRTDLIPAIDEELEILQGFKQNLMQQLQAHFASTRC